MRLIKIEADENFKDKWAIKIFKEEHVSDRAKVTRDEEYDGVEKREQCVHAGL